MESDRKLLFKDVIEYFAYAAIAVQAVLAAFWLFKNIGVLRSDYVTHTYILAADTLKVDDSMGILYALLIRLIGHAGLLHVFQILVLSASVFFFALSAFEKKPGLILALLTVLNPLILQAETAVSPNALVLACILLAVTAAIKIAHDKRWIGVFFGAGFLAGFLHPDYAYIFFIVGVLYVVTRSVVTRKFEVLLAAVCIVAFMVPVLMNGSIRDDYAYGRVHRTAHYLAVQRVVWPHVFESASVLQRSAEETVGMKEDMGYQQLGKESDKIPENLAFELGYKYEQLVGADNAQVAYRNLVKDSLAKGFGFWGREVIRDELLYFFSPVTATVAFLKQTTDTSVPCGLDFLFDKAPKTSKIFFIFSSWVSFLITLMYIVKGIGERVIGKKEPDLALAFTLLGMIALFSLYATFVCVRLYDYRNVLFMIIGWPAAAMAFTERRKTL